jgi:hypothetical protein
MYRMEQTNQDVHEFCYKQATAERPCWQKNVFFALPFTSMPDLELPVHPIPTNSNAFMARSPPNSHCHAICLYSCAHQHLHHYFEYYCLCWTRKYTSAFSNTQPSYGLQRALYIYRGVRSKLRFYALFDYSTIHHPIHNNIKARYIQYSDLRYMVFSPVHVFLSLFSYSAQQTMQGKKSPKN